MTALEQKKIPSVLTSIFEIRYDIKELQRLALIPSGFSLKGARAFQPEEGSITPRSAPAGTTAPAPTGASAEAAQPPGATSRAGLATPESVHFNFDDLEVAEASRASLGSAAETQAHISIRERIEAIEEKLVLMREQHFNIATPPPQPGTCREGQGGVH